MLVIVDVKLAMETSALTPGPDAALDMKRREAVPVTTAPFSRAVLVNGLKRCRSEHERLLTRASWVSMVQDCVELSSGTSSTACAQNKTKYFVSSRSPYLGWTAFPAHPIIGFRGIQIKAPISRQINMLIITWFS